MDDSGQCLSDSDGYNNAFYTVMQGAKLKESLWTSTCGFRGGPGIDIQLADGERKNGESKFNS